MKSRLCNDRQQRTRVSVRAAWLWLHTLMGFLNGWARGGAKAGKHRSSSLNLDMIGGLFACVASGLENQVFESTTTRHHMLFALGVFWLEAKAVPVDGTPNRCLWISVQHYHTYLSSTV